MCLVFWCLVFGLVSTTRHSTLNTKYSKHSRKMNPLQYVNFWKPFREDTTRTRDILPFHQEYQDLLHNTEVLAYLIRSYTIYEMTCAALGHPGGSFSEAEITAVLYNYVLHFRAKRSPLADAGCLLSFQMSCLPVNLYGFRLI